MDFKKNRILPVPCNRHITTNYDLFSLIVGNRPIDNSGIERKKIKRDMKEKGWKPYEPMLVIEVNGMYLIVDGQHRYFFAVELQIPIIFEVIDATEDEARKIMIDIQSGKSWNVENYADMYIVTNENPDLKVAKNFAAEHGITLRSAASLLVGHLPASNNMMSAIVDGTYSIKKECVPYANRTVDIYHKFPFTDYKLLNACGMIAHASEIINIETLFEKIDKYKDLIKKCASTDLYLTMIGDIYNKRTNILDRIVIIDIVKKENARRSNNLMCTKKAQSW